MPSTRSPRRALTAAVALLALTTTATACGADAAAGAQTKELRYQGSVGQVTLPELAADLGYLGDVKLNWIGNVTGGPADIQATATGQSDFGGAFNGAIVKLQAANAPITAVVSYYGSDAQTFQGYYVLDGSPIRGPRDLIGKRVGMNTLGAHAEAVLRTWLARGGLTAAEIGTVELVALPPVNTEQSLRARQIDVAVLGGVIRDKAVANGGIRTVFTDYELLGAFSAGSYVFRDDFLTRNPDTVRTFVTAVGKAIEWARTQPRETVVARLKAIIAKRGRNEDTTLVEYWKSSGVAEPGGLITDREFATWIDWLADTGELKGERPKPSDLYTNRFNAAATPGGGA
ncbi:MULTISPECIES: ABC transporter substrate-binding protein [Micromonospora]|uniref:ABC transporter substrate-binding protein n=1 Tax=Micromonospora chalcea TaxID=1874 RepID=A0ABX9YAL6_MICCH|nr:MULTISPECIES: ABC transporter substrate-binding protein [Micromonospora]ODB75056.1 ABC transporter substrate-binding protein [Micromonospora sp. II]RQW94570.1 ABC transporter substrate-binding protein [Micromonospora chalcea]RQX59810.1 ABC transporter substrate-binding protein [Micromonospora chalcea]